MKEMKLLQNQQPAGVVKNPMETKIKATICRFEIIKYTLFEAVDGSIVFGIK